MTLSNWEFITACAEKWCVVKFLYYADIWDGHSGFSKQCNIMSHWPVVTPRKYAVDQCTGCRWYCRLVPNQCESIPTADLLFRPFRIWPVNLWTVAAGTVDSLSLKLYKNTSPSTKPGPSTLHFNVNSGNDILTDQDALHQLNSIITLWVSDEAISRPAIFLGVIIVKRCTSL